MNSVNKLPFHASYNSLIHHASSNSLHNASSNSPCIISRVVTTSIRCFHKIKSNIRSRCSHDDSAEEYHHNFIQPLVDQTRAIVLAHCSLSPPYKQYFVQSPPSAALSSSSTSWHRRPMREEGLALLSTLVVLLSLRR